MQTSPDRIAYLRSRGRELAQSHLGLDFKRRGSSWKACCPLHEDGDASMDWNVLTHTFRCFGCGWKGGDIFALWIALRGGSFPEAVAALDDGAPLPASIPSRPVNRRPEPPTRPSPPGAGEPPRYPALGGRWHYTDASGRTLGFQDRLDDSDGRKVGFRSWRWCVRDRRWEAKAIVAPRPLYGLLGLLSRSLDPVLITEGEKACDAAHRTFRDFACITSMGGSSAARSTDWTPIKASRRVVLWPDNDAAGYRYARDVAAILAVQGVALLVVRPSPAMPSGFDLADELPEGLSLDDLRQLLIEAHCLEGIER